MRLFFVAQLPNAEVPNLSMSFYIYLVSCETMVYVSNGRHQKFRYFWNGELCKENSGLMHWGVKNGELWGAIP